MAWYNPSTWTPVDNIQNALGSFKGTSPSGPVFTNKTGIAPTQSAPAPSPAQPSANQTYDNTGGSYTGGSTGGSSAPTVDPQVSAYYDDAQNRINSGLGRLDNQLNIGLGNVNNAYQGSLNTLLGQKAIADRNYQTSKDQTLQDNVAAKSNIDFGVGQHNNALQRLLGSHGYTGSANLAASYAAAQQGSQQRNQVSKEFGRNQQALDTNYGDYKNEYDGSVNDLGTQKQNQESQLRAQIDQNKAGLLGQLAQIVQQRGQAAGKTYTQAQQDATPYQQQIDAINGQIDSLGANAQFTPKAATYHAPTLESYNYDKTSAPEVGALGGPAGNLGNYVNVLLGQQKKQQDNPLLGS